MSWNRESELKLKDLWKKGLTGSEIAKNFGTTRSAILGKVHRLKLEPRATSKKTSIKVNKENNNTQGIKTQKLGRKAKFRALLLDPSFPPENPVTILELTDDICRYPLGEKFQPANLFCGRKTQDKFKYCALHIMVCYQRKDEKEEDIITEEDIPKFITKKIKSA